MRIFMTIGLGLVMVFSVEALPSDVETQLKDKPEQSVAPETSPATPPPAPRGRQLYENHCIACHDSVVHVRNARKAKNLAALRGWVVRWSGELELKWGDSEVTDVVMYLNEQFYHF